MSSAAGEFEGRPDLGGIGLPHRAQGLGEPSVDTDPVGRHISLLVPDAAPSLGALIRHRGGDIVVDGDLPARLAKVVGKAACGDFYCVLQRDSRRSRGERRQVVGGRQGQCDPGGARTSAVTAGHPDLVEGDAVAVEISGDQGERDISRFPGFDTQHHGGELTGSMAAVGVIPAAPQGDPAGDHRRHEKPAPPGEQHDDDGDRHTEQPAVGARLPWIGHGCRDGDEQRQGESDDHRVLSFRFAPATSAASTRTAKIPTPANATVRGRGVLGGGQRGCRGVSHGGRIDVGARRTPAR